MKENPNRYSEIDEVFLNDLVRHALMYSEATLDQNIIDQSDRELTASEKLHRDQSCQQILKRLKHYERVEKRQRHLRGVRSVLPKVVNIAAAFVLVVGISLPIAVATQSDLLSRVFRVTMQEEPTHTKVRFEVDESASFLVPAGWTGLYFPSYIPEGYEVWKVEELPGILFRNADGVFISFDEEKPNANPSIDSENMTKSYVQVGGYTAMILQKESHSSITWQSDDRLFHMFITASGEEARQILIDMARSVKRIII